MDVCMLSDKLSGHYINGEWMLGNGVIFHSLNPASGEIIWQGTEAIQEEVAMAFDGARLALPGWSRLDYISRSRIIQSFAKCVENRKDAITRLISQETGKPLWEASIEVSSVIAKINISIKAYNDRCASKQTTNPEANAILRYKPHGVVAVLGPFNFPAHLSNGHIIPALLAGNTVVYKPSELTPAVAELMMQCFHESGLPAGVVQCVQGGILPAQHLLSADIQGVFFTGSYQTGVKINQQFANRPEVILALEMGGNNPLIIDAVSDIKAAVYYSVLSSFMTAGQRCTCARRMFIPNTSVGDVFLKQLIAATQQIKVGSYSSQPEPFMGPVIRYEHALHHLTRQEALIQSGGQSLLKMSLMQANTGFLSPGLVDMTGASNVQDEEIFAPLLQIYRYDDFDSAIEMANQTAYGLAAGLFSDNVARYQQFYDKIRAGLVNWNRPTTGASSVLPFGGVGKSGNHRPSAYFAADYCAYPIASLEQPFLAMPDTVLPGVYSDF